ncbi:MAG: cell division topological specificity factor MinE [Lachnospiraceae bacterium]|nr:cell division topological specificity factor MinE [Lachnospiraceae bacterium]
MGVFSWHKRKSGSIAKDRLKVLLIAERLECSPSVMVMLKNDMIQTASKYLAVDEQKVAITYTQTPEKLIAEFPLRHSLKKIGNKETND